MSKTKLTDAEGKARLRLWPDKTGIWTLPDARPTWMRGQPSDLQSRAPSLAIPGTRLFKTQPDGLWIRFAGASYCDLVVVEVCGTFQNLNDKRARYLHTAYSILLHCPRTWLARKIPTRGTGERARWEIAGFAREPSRDRRIPVRTIRTLFALPNKLYNKWRDNIAPAGHEYFCQHSSLASFTASPMQRFLKGMAPAHHYYT